MDSNDNNTDYNNNNNICDTNNNRNNTVNNIKKGNNCKKYNISHDNHITNAMMAFSKTETGSWSDKSFSLFCLFVCRSFVLFFPFLLIRPFLLSHFYHLQRD